MYTWLYPANTKYYKVLEAFDKDFAYWPIKTKVEKDDIVFIYLAAPYKQIAYKTQVIDTGKTYDEVEKHVIPFLLKKPDGKSDREFMKLKVIDTFKLDDSSSLSLPDLRENGLNGMLMGPRKLDNNPELLQYITSN